MLRTSSRILFKRSFSTYIPPKREIINIVFVDYEVCYWQVSNLLSNFRSVKLYFLFKGNRVTVPAKVGSTLLQVAQAHKVDLEGSCQGGAGKREVRRTENWVETTYGEGPSCFHCHVQIPKQFDSLLPPITEYEADELKFMWDEEYNPSSRLACLITLEKKHDGLIVFVPDAQPTNVI